MFAHDAAHILRPAQAPEGRSHYDGQRALYLSASPEGCVIAVRRYMRLDDPARAIFPLRVRSDRIIDLRDKAATAHFEIDTTHRAAEWQASRAAGQRAPTWDISDAVRALGLGGMLYASRTDPTKTHLTLFHWSAATVTADGPPLPAPAAHLAGNVEGQPRGDGGSAR